MSAGGEKGGGEEGGGEERGREGGREAGTEPWRARLEEEERRVEEGGGRARQARQARLGRGTAIGRIEALVDPGSFVELARHVKHRFAAQSDVLASNRPPGDGLRAGFARVAGRPVAVYAHDPTVLRGALGHAASRKLVRLLDAALARDLPVLSLVDCDGVRVDEGTFAVDAYGEVIDRTIRLRARGLQLTLVCGLGVGAAAYQAALTDLVGMVEGQSFLFITGAKLTRVMTGQEVGLEELGGPAMHASTTGACHAVLEDEAAGVAWLRRALALLTDARVDTGDAPGRPTPEVGAIVPTDPRRGYDARKVLEALTDRGTLLELGAPFARNLLTAFGRLGGRAVAFLASQPQHRAGCLDVDASRKGSAFVRLASKRGLPLVTLCDVPGYWPGKEQEQGGILPFGAELLDAYGRCRSPRLAVLLRKSYGGANVLSYAADYRLALPTAQVAPMGVDAAERLAMPPLGEDAGDAERAVHDAERERFRARWLALHGDVWAAAHEGYVDRVVPPEALRASLCEALVALEGEP
ncbi:MAG TPA: carboxyl transferase domain-containing protein [Polyangiaceae bacterium LLY-WYZ-15_(1-7)]|nr:hypothetical protein [Myxococcales bacterium]MAT28041.1 hypothetical protein [Sandaracinus sp.]MBJ71715.1 hypothetical protein [Sandaracinus sp.]HJL06540.1 carboxyl transferase domain-containing protein [Polyangiaceae bacterium LLY-WYZ-15_(1-7)]HJL12594.1 carboxyl transferase domain-containing protein [Polyangiaceae bacterium LLY-WYZ-15_(1-7)]